MTDRTDDRTVIDGTAREWHAPTLSVLGDARTLTESGGTITPDGGGNNQGS